MSKRYYWLKLKEDFFRQKEIKKLRKIAGGDTYTIIYLKMQLLSLKNEGKLFFDGIEETFEEELALEIDEEVENVKVTLLFLLNNNLIESVEEDEYFLIKANECIGSEGASAERVRRYREKKKQLEGQPKLQCNNEVTNGNTEKRTEKRTENREQIQQQDKITNILKEFNENEIKSIVKFCKVNNISVDVVIEKWEIVKNLKKVRNRVGALIAAIENDWEKPISNAGITGNKFVDGCSSRNYDDNDFAEKEKKLLGWDVDE